MKQIFRIKKSTEYLTTYFGTRGSNELVIYCSNKFAYIKILNHNVEFSKSDSTLNKKIKKIAI